jgi:ethanolamine utilization protein EutQ
MKMAKRVITVADVFKAVEAGEKTLNAPSDQCVVTPSALDKAEELGISIAQQQDGGAASAPKACGVPADPHATVVKEVVSLLSRRMPPGVDAENLQAVVSQVVAAKMSAKPTAAPAQVQTEGPVAKLDGVTFVSGERLLKGGAEPVPVDEKVLIADAIDCGDDSKLAGGYMEWEKASFRRSVEQAEMAIVLEGELHLTVGGKVIKGKAGDMLYLPKGANLIYSAPDKVRLACVNCVL